MAPCKSSATLLSLLDLMCLMCLMNPVSYAEEQNTPVKKDDSR